MNLNLLICHSRSQIFKTDTKYSNSVHFIIKDTKNFIYEFVQ
jgi:hypothetical protein